MNKLPNSYEHIDLDFGVLLVSGEGSIRDLFCGYRETWLMDDDVGEALESLAKAIYNRTGETPRIQITDDHE